MDLIEPVPIFDLYNRDWPVYSWQRSLPPAKLVRAASGRSAMAIDSLVCPGAIVSGGTVQRSIVGSNCYVDRDALIEDSILFDGVVVQPGAVVRRAIIDKNVIVPPGMVIGGDRDHDDARFTVSASGITVVAKNQSLADHT